MTTPQEEVERRLSAYVHPSSAHIDPKLLITADPVCRAYVDGFLACAEWQAERLGPLVEAARAYRDAKAEWREAKEYYTRKRVELRLFELTERLHATAAALDEEGGE